MANKEYAKQDVGGFVNSKILGLVYTDLVCYILPGFLLLCGAISFFEKTDDVKNLITGQDSVPALVFVLAVTVISYLGGLLVGFIRWHVYGRIEDCFQIISLSRLINNKVSFFVRRRVMLSKQALDSIQNKIASDMKKLKWVESTEMLDTEEEMVHLVDGFWNLIEGTTRDQGGRLALSYERWDDLLTSQKCFVIVIQILAIFWVVTHEEQGLGTAITITAIIELALISVYFFLLPISHYSHMRWLLLSYLAGRINVMETKKEE
ncbi:MAG: hypothetical protein ACUZ8I_05320 [Candidatus Scalindua sp.]